VRAVLGKRLGRFGLTLHPDNTRLWPFWHPPQAQQRGKGPATCAFLGCTFSWARSRQGSWRRWCKTRRASLRRAKQANDDWCRRHRHQPVEAQHAALGRRLRGHCNSFGVSGNCRSLRRLVAAPKRAWYKWLCRRSQRKRLHWERLTELLRQRPLPRPRITVRIWGVSPRVTLTEEPDGGNLLVRIWRGAGVGNLPAYSTRHFCFYWTHGSGSSRRWRHAAWSHPPWAGALQSRPRRVVPDALPEDTISPYSAPLAESPFQGLDQRAQLSRRLTMPGQTV
jgi:hypothetical protein